MKEIETMQNQNQVKYVPAGTGLMYWGPGDRVTFLVTGAESGGGCFIIEGMACPGGGPPPHVHRFEDESFYILQGTVTIQAAGGHSMRRRGISYTSRAEQYIRSRITGKWTPRRSS